MDAFSFIDLVWFVVLFIVCPSIVLWAINYDSRQAAKRRQQQGARLYGWMYVHRVVDLRTGYESHGGLADLLIYVLDTEYLRGVYDLRQFLAEVKDIEDVMGWGRGEYIAHHGFDHLLHDDIDGFGSRSVH